MFWALYDLPGAMVIMQQLQMEHGWVTMMFTFRLQEVMLVADFSPQLQACIVEVATCNLLISALTA